MIQVGTFCIIEQISVEVPIGLLLLLVACRWRERLRMGLPDVASKFNVRTYRRIVRVSLFYFRLSSYWWLIDQRIVSSGKREAEVVRELMKKVK